MVLKAKRLSYKVVEITPGLGQFAIFRMTGQKQVPVLVDGENVIPDSSAIIRHLETLYPHPQLIPEDPKQVAQVHLIEDWADTTMANGARTALLQAAAVDSELRKALLPEELPIPIRGVIADIPCGFVNGMSELISQNDQSQLMESLIKLSKSISCSNWLVGNEMSFADLAVAAQLSLLKFPSSSGSDLSGKGCPGFIDNPQLETLFNWRDSIELSLLKNSPSEH